MAIWMSLMVIISCCLPVHTQAADKGNIVISNIKADEGLQPGDSFSVSFSTSISFTSSNGGSFYVDASVNGGGVDSSKAYVKVDDEQVVSGGINGEKYIEISNLVYLGTSKEASINVSVIDSSNNVMHQESAKLTLSGKTTSDFADTLVAEKQDNLLVKTDGTQNVGVKITNKGNFTVNQAEVTLTLSSKVEGLTIKNNKSKITNIKSKEVKTATFTLAVDKETKAGVYPAIVSVMGNSYSVNVQVDSHVVPSALEVSLADKGVFTPGIEKDAIMMLKNIGDRDAKNIRIEMVNTEHVSVVENSNVKRLNLLAAKASESIAMKVRINSDYKGESVAIPMKINYLSSTGEAAEDTQYVYLYTNSTTAPSEVVISNVISPSGTFEVDEDFIVKFNISAKSAASNVQVSVEGDEGIVPKSQNLFFVNKLASGENKQYSVCLAATRAAVTSSHAIKITVTYGSSDKPTTINQYGSVNIKNSKKDKEDAKEDEKIKGKPKVIIGEYIIEPNIVRAGENFVLTLGFLNTSREHTVHNLKANILPVEQEKKDEDIGNVFTPVDGSNTIYIADLVTGETVTKVLNMYTIPSAAAKTYQITVDMAYEDEEGNEITAQESLGIPVEQMTKIEVGDINLSSGMVGDSIPVSVAFYNRGRTKVNNMMVYIEGEGFDVEENKTFIGTFDIGGSETYEPTIIPNQAGTLKGTLVVEYEDPSGEAMTERKEFEIEAEEMVMEDPNMDEMGMVPDAEPQKPNRLPLYIGIGTGILVAAIITIIVLKRKKAKKEKMMLDEED